MMSETENKQPEDMECCTAKKKGKKKLTKYEKWFRFMHRLNDLLIKHIFRYKKRGHTTPYNDRAYLIVGNHKSVLDVIPAAVTTDRPVHFIAKKEIWNKKLGRWFAEKCQCIPVAREGADVRAMMQAMKYLKNGENVSIFPEGTRNKTEEVFLPFKSGAAALSIKTKTPIIFVIQCKKLKAFRKSYVLYSEPFEFSDYYDKKLTSEELEICDGILRDRMLELYEEVKLITENKGKKCA